MSGGTRGQRGETTGYETPRQPEVAASSLAPSTAVRTASGSQLDAWEHELDAAGFPVTPPTLAGAHGKPAKCRRHDWLPAPVNEHGFYPREGETAYLGHVCTRCGIVKDEARSRRGKSARQRGNAYERELARKLGGKRTGQFGGPDDVTVSDLFVIQSKVRKAFPRWMADELAKLPRTGGRMPLLVVADSPGSAFRRTALVIIGLEDWIGLHGPTEAIE